MQTIRARVFCLPGELESLSDATFDANFFPSSVVQCVGLIRDYSAWLVITHLRLWRALFPIARLGKEPRANKPGHSPNGASSARVAALFTAFFAPPIARDATSPCIERSALFPRANPLKGKHANDLSRVSKSALGRELAA